MMRFSLFLLAAAALWAQPAPNPYPLGPDSQPNPAVPAGKVIRNLVLPPGKLYPGTPHDYAIYVPAQYDPAKPAPYMVFMDGLGQLGNGTRANVVFDNLIARHELPPIIGIFVNPGVLPAVGDARSRYERVFEYDSMSDRFSRFLLEELVPAVGAKYNLSKSGDDHALLGVSTGAVAAFVAAWNRPDQFHRVVTFIGTFVAMKGADSFPGLIRRTEAKPIRMFMQEGKEDHVVAAEPFGTFYAGSWPINNQVMYEALQYSGYDVKFEMGTDGHSGRHGSAILPDVLRWLWREYPAPITVKEPAHMSMPGWDPRGKVYSIVSADKGWEAVTEAMPANGVAKTIKGAAYSLAPGHKSVVFTPAGGKARALNLPEGVAASSVALSPDQAMLIVTDSGSRFQWSFQIAADGSIQNGEPFYRMEMPETVETQGATGAIEDSIGQVYFATPLGIQVCEANGRVAAILNSPVAGQAVTAVAWGGKDLDWIYAVTGGHVYRRAVKVKGTSSAVLVKLPQPPL